LRGEFRWRVVPVCTVLVAYVAVTVALALWTSVAAAVTLAVWLVIVLICAATERDGWSFWKRAGLVLGLWLVMVWPPTLIDPTGKTVYTLVFSAMALVTLVIAMRRSRLFVEAAY